MERPRTRLIQGYFYDWKWPAIAGPGGSRRIIFVSSSRAGILLSRCLNIVAGSAVSHRNISLFSRCTSEAERDSNYGPNPRISSLAVARVGPGPFYSWPLDSTIGGVFFRLPGFGGTGAELAGLFALVHSPARSIVLPNNISVRSVLHNVMRHSTVYGKSFTNEYVVPTEEKFVTTHVK